MHREEMFSKQTERLQFRVWIMIVEGESRRYCIIASAEFVGGENGHFVRLLTIPLFILRIDGGHIVSAEQ